MSLLSKKTFSACSTAILILAFLLTACQVFPSTTKGPVPTQDVGEEPPIRLLNPTPDPSAPISTLTQVIDNQPERMLLGPAPYPTPAEIPTPWKQLMDQSLIADLTWETFQGELLGKDKGSNWIYSFHYPAGWYVDTNASLILGFVQNIPLSQEPAASEFVKFEIVRLTAAPMIEEGHALDPNDLMTVEVAGERGILFSVTQQPGQMRQITVLFQHIGGWLAATGYINLPTADPAALDRCSAIILSMMSSFTFSGQVAQARYPSSLEDTPLTPQPDTGTLLLITLEKPFSKAAFEQGPFVFEFYLYQDPGFGPNPSMPWMYSDIPGVGTHVSWRYHGPVINDPVSESWGICPDINPGDIKSGLKEGDNGIRESGVVLPRNIALGSLVQFVFQVETSQGTYGGILSFTLALGSQGLEPSKVAIYGMHQVLQAQGCVADLPSSFMPRSTPTLTASTTAGTPSLSSGVHVEEHKLEKAPQVEPLVFIPVRGSQEDILREHQRQRSERFPDNTTVDQGRTAMWAA